MAKQIECCGRVWTRGRCRKCGKRLYPPENKKVLTRMNETLYAQLKQAVAKSGLTLNDACCTAFEEYIAKHLTKEEQCQISESGISPKEPGLRTMVK